MCLDDYRRLAGALRTPPMFTDVLPLIVSPDEVELLLRTSTKDRSVEELSELLNLPAAVAQHKVDDLYRRGFLTKKRRGLYSARPFERVISRHLSEGRADRLGKYAVALADYRMDEHVRQARADPHPEGKILPIQEAVIESVSVVLPYETAMIILDKARSISIRDCECRVTYDNCDSPLRTCLALNEFSDELVGRGVAKEIPLQEAKEVLRIANLHGLVHQALYTDWLKGEAFDLCSCCSCCCTYLRTLVNYEVKHHVARSGLVAKVNPNECVGCRVCLERCMFGARKLENGKSVVIEQNCYGCGLCTTTCKAHASRLASAVV